MQTVRFLLVLFAVWRIATVAQACCSTTNFVQTDCGGGPGCRTKHIRVSDAGSGNLWEDGTGNPVYCDVNQTCAAIPVGICSVVRAPNNPLKGEENIPQTSARTVALPSCASLRGERLEAYIATLRSTQH